MVRSRIVQSCATAFAAVLVLICALVLSSCEDTHAVAEFATAAARTVRQGPAIFTDLADTCDARHALDQAVAPAWDKPATAASEPETCARFRSESEELRAGSEVLQHYFEALRDLALFGSSKKDDDSSKNGDESVTKSNVTEKRIAATADLTQLIGRLVTERYQQSHLVKILTRADPDVAAIGETLEQTAAKQYQQELGVEEKDAQDLYFRFGKTDARQNAALLFLLNRAYRDDMNNIARRRRAADAYTAGMRKLREAHHQLLAASTSHDRKQFFSEAYAYGSQIEALAEEIQGAR